eukprot:Anaeramoba_flamelloidesc42431_g2_i2.p2 GENE.c42431_g2_i2~~c42431_g2_i2.p2  ORF type:complete len:115 (-),score=14.91 c42431_g2_i2:14-358(-)
MEVEVLQVLELGARGGEQLFAGADERVHGTAHIEKQQHLGGVVALGHHLQIQQASVAGGGTDGVVQVELVSGAGAGELAQLAQRHLDVAGKVVNGKTRNVDLATYTLKMLHYFM